MAMLKIVVAAAALLAGPAAWAAECAPAKMVKVTYRDITPGRNPATMTPITMYRLTERHARIEQGPNRLMVVAEPDVWMADPVAKTGQHIIDPGPILEFRAPIFTAQGAPAVFARLETGCELDFLDTFAPRPVGELKVDGMVLDRHEVSLGPDRVEILVRRGLRQVYSVAHYRGEKPLVMLRYLDHATGLAPDMELFAKPAGVTFTKVNSGGGAPPKS